MTPSHAKPQGCHPGMSYNPHVEDHQDIVATAVAVELRREEAKGQKDPLWENALTKKRDETGNSTEESESENEETSASIPILKRENRGKLTRAEKNRRARHSHNLMLQRQAKRNKAILSQISSAKSLAKQISMSEDAAQQTRRTKDVIISSQSIEDRLEKKFINPNAKLNAPEVPAPLSDELKGNLRSLKTKSSIVLEQFEAKQYAIDPALKMKRLLKGSTKTKKGKQRLKIRKVDRYFDGK